MIAYAAAGDDAGVAELDGTAHPPHPAGGQRIHRNDRRRMEPVHQSPHRLCRFHAGGPQHPRPQGRHRAEPGKVLGHSVDEMAGDEDTVRRQRADGVRRHGLVSKAHHQHRTAVRGQLLDLLTNGPHRPVEKPIPPLPEGGEVKGAVAARRFSQSGFSLLVQNIHSCDRIPLYFLLRGLYACQPGGFSGGFLPQLVGLDCQIRPFCKHFALLTQNLVVLRVAFAEIFVLYKKI